MNIMSINIETIYEIIRKNLKNIKLYLMRIPKN